MAIIISRVRLRWVKKENRQQFHLHNLLSFGPSYKMERAKEVNHFNNNSLHKQTLHRQHLLVPHKPPKNKKQPMPKKAGVMTMTPTGQKTGQGMNPIMDMMEITPKVIGTMVQLVLLCFR